MKVVAVCWFRTDIQLLCFSVFTYLKNIRMYILKRLILVSSLLLLFVWKSTEPTSAQRPFSETPPSPVEPALPPVPPIQPERVPEIPEPLLEAIPNTPTQTTEDATSSVSCLPLSQGDEARFNVTEIEVVGSTILQSEIAQLVDCYKGQFISLSDLFNLRSQITQLYIQEGYVTSGAFIPIQTIGNTTVEVKVIEGGLEAVRVNGLTRLRKGYVESRISGTTPLNQAQLRESLQLLQLDPNIREVNAELTAGSQPGRSLLILDLSEPSPFNVLASTDNFRSPSIGSEGLNISASYRNLLGIGDVVAASYGLTEGLNLYDVSLAIPFNAKDGTLNIGYNNSDSRIVEDAFEEVGIRSETETVSVGIRQPVVRTPSEEFALGLDFDWRRSTSFILDDIPFSFSEGPVNGRSQVSALRFSQDWTKRGDSRVLAARSQFNVGLDIFGATDNDTGTDARFFSWIGQFQWVEQVSPRMLSLVKFNTQLTPDSLLPIERFSLGGISTVRGYPQNELVTDNALNASAELRIPLTRDANTLQITPFIDAGFGWNNRTASPDSNFLLGTGIGFRWQATPNLFLRTDYGLPLVNSNDRSGSLQENGLYFSLTYQP